MNNTTVTMVKRTLIMVEKQYYDTYFHDYLVSLQKTFSHFQIIAIPFQLFAGIADIANAANSTLVDQLFINPAIANIVWVQRCPLSPEVAAHYRRKYSHIKWYLLNMEQLTSSRHYEYLRNQLSSQSHYLDGLIDYQYANKSVFLKKRKETQTHSHSHPIPPYYIIPYQLHDDEYLDQEKIYDCAIIGLNSERRQLIYQQLQRAGIRILNIEGWGLMRDNLLFRCKILVNVHHSEDYNIYETIRCDRCTWNKMIVISEESEESEEKVEQDKNSLKKYIIECPYDNIVEMAGHVLQNYDIVYEHIFGQANQFEEDKRRIQQQRREINFT